MMPLTGVDSNVFDDWRSVNLVANKFCLILYANQFAPKFIKENSKKILPIKK